jgi:hypothetical protein
MLLAFAYLGVCAYTSSQPTHHRQLHDDQDNHHWHLSWVTDACKVDWTADGQISYTEDGMDVAKLSPGGMLTVVQEYGDHSRRVELSEKSGMLDRKYTVDGMSKPWDHSAADWFGELLEEVDHTTGALASVRFPRLMSAGGPSAVLSDIQGASGSAQATYIRMLMQSGKLGSGDACHIADFTRAIPADHEKADILVEVAGQIDFAAAACRDSYFASVSTINGDYERARAEIAAMEHAPASGPALDAFAVAALTVARQIASDHEKEHVLVTFAPRCSGDSARTAYLATARTIASDAERARALTALVRQQ